MASSQPTIDLHASRSNQILVPAILCPALATLTILLRLYTRVIVLKDPAADDLFAVIALILSIGNSAVQAYEVKYGFGRHAATLTPTEVVGSLKSLFASIIFYNLALTSIKLSIVLLYLRLFASPISRRICYALVAIMVAYGVETLFSGVFTCTPVAYFWNSKIPGGHCVDKTTLYFANAGINIVTDVALLIIPVIFLRRLLMPMIQRVLVMVIVAFGGLACIASALRLRTLYVSTKSKDPTWDKVPTAYWSTIEINVGIICASLSTLRALASRMFPNLFDYKKQVQTSAIDDTGMARMTASDDSEKRAFDSNERIDIELRKPGSSI